MTEEEFNWTGERLTTSVEGVIGVAEHLHRYALACEYIQDKHVCDIASGEGYGSFLMSKVAKSVVGIDISEDAVKHAIKKYKNSNNLTYQIGSCASIPLADSSIDVLVSFETLEHTFEQKQFINEIYRVLKEDGLLIMSTPDTVHYKKREPENPFHLKELSTIEFIDLISTKFSKYCLLKQRCVTGSLITAEVTFFNDFKAFYGDYENIKEGYGIDGLFGPPFFNLIMASNKVFDLKPFGSLFNYVPIMLTEFNSSIGLLHELKNTKKELERYREVEKSLSYKLASLVSKFLKSKQK